MRGLKLQHTYNQPYALSSHPSRVRGLKSFLLLFVCILLIVAPFTGAWIEIRVKRPAQSSASRSHPSRVRGLKSVHVSAVHPVHVVAPFTGAWIEIKVLNLIAFFFASSRTLHGCVD